MNEFDWLRSLAEDPIPTEAWIDKTRGRLLDYALVGAVSVDDDSAAEEKPRTRLRPTRFGRGRPTRIRMRWVSATAFVLVVSTLVISVALRPTPAIGLLDVARATEVLPSTEFIGAQVIRTIDEEILVIEQIATNGETARRVMYLLPRTQIRRQAADGSLQIETVPGMPVFFTPDDEEFFGEAVEQRVQPGVITIETFTEPEESGSGIGLLTDDADVLAQRLAHDIAIYGDSALPDGVETMQWIANIYRSELPTPTERAALLRVLAGVGGIDAAPVGDFDGAGATLTHSGHGTRERFTLHFDGAGWLVFEEVLLLDGIPEVGVPAGVALQRSHYEPPRLAEPVR
ncbi:MAG: hypothetical protein U9R47_09930 [Actinomycetota bacterium]|nr:hypothetical protein [Actinomycetota bacterium]